MIEHSEYTEELAQCRDSLQAVADRLQALDKTSVMQRVEWAIKSLETTIKRREAEAVEMQPAEPKPQPVGASVFCRDVSPFGTQCLLRDGHKEGGWIKSTHRDSQGKAW